MEDLKRKIDFCLEVEKMNSVFRKTRLLDSTRFENDAEHSFHVALMAVVLSDYADEEIDISRVVKMLLLHDLAEIYAGDTFAYDEEGKKTQKDREKKAADKLFSILPEKEAKEFKNIFFEFNEMTSADSIFANAIDRLQPMLLNYFSGGGSWKEHRISKQEVLNRLGPLSESSKTLYEYMFNLITNFFGED